MGEQVRLAALFPGQGSQYIGMGKKLCQYSKAARSIFDQADEILEYPLSHICFEGNVRDINELQIMFAAILTCDIAVYHTFMERIGIQPIIGAGHSLGEYAALVCAGIMKFEDALKLVILRAKLAKEEAKGKSCSVIAGLNKDQVQKLLDEYQGLAIAGFNAERQILIAGEAVELYKCEKQIVRQGVTVTPLPFSPPIHTFHMKETISTLRKALERCDFGIPKWKIISNFDSQFYTGNKKTVLDKLLQQMVSPVLWTKAMECLNQYDIDLVVEMSTRNILTNLLNTEKIDYFSLSYGKVYIQELEQNENRLSNHIFQKELINKSLMIAASTRNRNWDEKSYEEKVRIPWLNLENLDRKLQEENTVSISPNEILGYLKEILVSKQLERKIVSQKLFHAAFQSGDSK